MDIVTVIIYIVIAISITTYAWTYIEKNNKKKKMHDVMKRATEKRIEYKKTNTDFRDILDSRDPFGIYDFRNMRLLTASKYALNITPLDNSKSFRDNLYFHLEIYINNIIEIIAIELSESNEITELLNFNKYRDLKRYIYPIYKTNYTLRSKPEFLTFIAKEVPGDLIQELYIYLKQNSNNILD